MIHFIIHCCLVITVTISYRSINQPEICYTLYCMSHSSNSDTSSSILFIALYHSMVSLSTLALFVAFSQKYHVGQWLSLAQLLYGSWSESKAFLWSAIFEASEKKTKFVIEMLTRSKQTRTVMIKWNDVAVASYSYKVHNIEY